MAPLLIGGLLTLVSADPAAASDFTLSGSVSDVSSQPVAGVVVTALIPNTQTEVISSVSDASGLYSLLLAAGFYDVRFTPPSGSELVESTLQSIVVSDETQLNVVLTEALPPPPPPPVPATVTGVVRDASGAPLAGWDVSFNADPAGVLTGPDGSYTLQTVVGGGREVWLIEGTTGCFPFCRSILFAGNLEVTGDMVMDLTLPTVELAVTVTDTAGNPVPGATVEATIGAGPPPYATPLITGGELFPGSNPIQGWHQVSKVTDASGLATVQILATTTTTANVTVTPPPGSNLSGVNLSGVSVETTNSFTLLIASMRGALRDSSGAALPGQIVELEAVPLGFAAGGGAPGGPVVNGAATGDSSVTDSAGSYALTVSPGEYQLRVRNGTTPDQRLPAVYDVLVDDVDLTTGLVQNLELPVSTTTLTVIGPDQAPVSGAVVSVPCSATSFELFPGGMASGTVCESGVTDELGVVQLALLPMADLVVEIDPPSGSNGLTQVTSHLGPVSSDTSFTVPLIPPPVVLPGGAGSAEGNAGSRVLHVKVRLSSPSNLPVSVQWATDDDSAQPEVGVDYDSTSGTVIFNPGETLKTVPVTIHSDVIDEADEWIPVLFSNATNATVGGLYGFGFGVIVDDDPPPTVRPGGASVIEGDSGTTTLNVPVNLSNPSGKAVTVAWRTIDTLAQPVAGVDYAPAAGTLTFAPGETTKLVPVTVYGDTEVEPGTLWGAEWGAIQLSAASNAKFGPSGFDRIGFALIVDDDSP